MAINKNFVIKHGVEVDTKLLVGDSNTQKVGIGTTVPQYSLHVGGLRGGIGATDAYISGVTTVRDLHVTGITTFDTGRVLIGAGESTGTRGQILHVGSSTTEGGVYISGDVGLGVTLPGAKLNVVPGSSAIAGLFSGTTEKDMVRITQLGGGNALRIDDIASDASPFVVTGIGSVGIGTTNPEYTLVVDSLVSTGTTALFVHGDAQITGDLIVDDFNLDELTVDQVNVTGILTSAQTKLNGITTAVNINVTGITTFKDDVIFDATNDVTFDNSESALVFNDGAAIRVGTGSDFSIMHDGSNTILKDNGTGAIHIRGDAIAIQNAGGTETQALFTEDDSVDLYFNGTERLSTTAIGATVFGDFIVAGVTTAEALNISGVSTFTSVGSNLIPDADGTRNIGAATSEWGDLFLDGTAKIDALEADTAKIGDLTDNRVVIAGTSGELEDSGNLTFDGSTLAVTGDQTVSGKITVGSGASIHANGNLAVAGVGTINGGLIVGAGATFTGNILPEADGTRDIGASGLEWKDLYIDGTANIDSLAADTAAIGDLTDNRVVIAGSSGELEDDANFTFDGSKLNVGVGVATIGVNGNAAFAGIVTVGGNLYVTGDIHYDEVTGRNLNISGIATFAEIGSNLIPDADGSRNIGAAGSEWQDLHIDGTANIDSLIADTAQVSDLTNTRVVYAGASGELSDDSTLTFNSTTKVLSVQELVGVHTSAGGGGVGIASTTAHVGYGFTYIQFKGPGVSTVYASSTTGIATIFFQGGGSNAGAAGTWTPEGSIGISTSKSIGVNTTSISDADLQGIGNTFQGVYIGNGMLVTDNQLNGNHYIGTAYNGLMAGPVTVNGVLTVDGNWVVV